MTRRQRLAWWAGGVASFVAVMLTGCVIGVRPSVTEVVVILFAVWASRVVEEVIPEALRARESHLAKNRDGGAAMTPATAPTTYPSALPFSPLPLAELNARVDEEKSAIAWTVAVAFERNGLDEWDLRRLREIAGRLNAYADVAQARGVDR